MSETIDHQQRVCARVLIAGRVQGVGYRWATLTQAQQSGVHGWVRNLSDGRVEAIFEGKKSVVEQLVKWCHTGSSTALVENVVVVYQEPTGIEGFEIRH